MENNPLRISQILTLAKVSKSGRTNLRKKVRQYLGISENSQLYLDLGQEIFISPLKPKKGYALKFEKNGILLPEAALHKLQLDEDRLVGLVEREKAVSIKTFELKEKRGEHASWYDIESPAKIIRWLETNPEPGVLLGNLAEQNRDLKLKYDVRSFLRNNQTLDGLLARRLLSSEESADARLQQQLIQKRLDHQQKTAPGNPRFK